METNSTPIPSSDSDLRPTRTRKSGKGKWFTLLGIVAAIGFVVLLALPTMLGSKWIYEPLLKRLAQDQFTLDIQSVKLRWFSPLEFQGISISQPRNEATADAVANTAIHASKEPPPLISIQTIRSNRGLLGYLLNGRNLGRVEIIEPKLDIALLEDGSNLERLIKSIEGKKTPEPNTDVKPDAKIMVKTQPKLDLDIAIRGLSVQVDPNSGAPIQVIPKMNADISYRALDTDAQLIVQPMKVLDQVVLTPELVRLGVGLAVPLLAKSAWFDGRVSLSTQEIRVPLNRPVDSKGEATLTLHQVRSGPSEPLIVGALDALANLRGKEASHELVFVDGSQVIIRLDNQRVFHSGLEAGLPKLDQRLQIATQGYVGLVDRSLDLTVEIPVPIEQIAQRAKVQQLGVPRIKLPVGGTLDDPEIKWSVMRGDSAILLSAIAGKLQSDAPIASTIVDALGDVTDGKADQAIATAVDFVKALRQRKAEEKANKSEEIMPPGTNPNKEPESKRPIRDALKKILKGD